MKYYVICALKAHIDNVFLMSIHEKGNEYNDISWNKQRVFIHLEFIHPHYQILIQAITLVTLGKSVKF